MARPRTQERPRRRWRPPLRRWPLGLALGLLCAAAARPAAGQRPNETIVPENRRVIRLNWVVRQLEPVPPFDEEFYLVATMPAADSVLYEYGRRRVVSSPAGTRSEIESVLDRGKAVPRPVFKADQFSIRVLPLEPDVPYLFRFTVYPRRANASAAAPRPLRVDVATTAKSNFGDHIRYDAGVLGADRTGYRGLVAGVNFYAVPINSRDDLSRSTPAEQVLKRVGLFAGLSFRAFRAPAEMSDFYAHIGHPVLGVGVRRLPGVPGLRVGTGLMWYRQDDANPLVTRLRTKRDVFVSVTFGPSMNDVFRRRR